MHGNQCYLTFHRFNPAISQSCRIVMRRQAWSTQGRNLPLSFLLVSVMWWQSSCSCENLCHSPDWGHARTPSNARAEIQFPSRRLRHHWELGPLWPNRKRGGLDEGRPIQVGPGWRVFGDQRHCWSSLWGQRPCRKNLWHCQVVQGDDVIDYMIVINLLA